MTTMTKLRLATASALALALGTGAALAEDFSLDALIAAAKGEPPLAVSDSTGKIKQIAEAFAKKYGIATTGTKIKAEAAVEMMDREARAKNVQGDVFIITDGAAVRAQLIPSGAAMSWLPPDLASDIPEEYRDPLVVYTSQNVWTYNAELSDSCPVKNIWELTEPKWKGHVAMQDPLSKPTYTDWFNQMETHYDDAVAAAYQEQYGKPLETDAGSATKAWVKALAANAPLLGSSDSAAAETVGAPGQKDAFMGLMSTAKYRDNADSGYKLGLCDGIKPYVGFRNPGVGVIATGTDSPNASKLFIHYMLTAEGNAPLGVDGKQSANQTVPLPDDEPSGIGKHLDQLPPYYISTAGEDFDTRQDWQDFWRLNYGR